jgi:toxin YoeB
VQLSWTPEGWDDYVSLQSGDPDVVHKINTLIKEIKRDHFSGIGKPEPLKGDFRGWWSRRITSEHRLVYRVTGKDREKRLEIAQCRFHYRKT